MFNFKETKPKTADNIKIRSLLKFKSKKKGQNIESKTKNITTFLGRLLFR